MRGQFIDLAGKRFGRLLVSERLLPPKRGGVQWKCLCDCGQPKIAKSYNLLGGSVTSCGCLAIGPRPYRIKNLLGRTFGQLTVVEMGPRATARNETRWWCECSCGERVLVWRWNLLSENTTSCGCLKTAERPDRQIDLAGRRFGRLIAIQPAAEQKKGNRQWVCRCDCGREKILDTGVLNCGVTISCGCAANQGPLKKFRPTPVRNKSSTHRRNRDLRLIGRYTEDEVEALFLKQKGKCANCIEPIERGEFHRDHKVPVSRGGLNVIANIQLLCAPCNRRKHAYTHIEFAQMEGRLL